MKKILLAVFSLISIISYSQTTGYLRYDSVKVMKQNGNSTLIIENATRNVTNGFLQNYSEGRTKFARALDSVWIDGDSIRFRYGTATLSVGLPSGANIYNSDGVITGTGTRSIDVDGNDLLFDNAGNFTIRRIGGASGFSVTPSATMMLSPDESSFIQVSDIDLSAYGPGGNSLMTLGTGGFRFGNWTGTETTVGIYDESGVLTVRNAAGSVNINPLDSLRLFNIGDANIADSSVWNMLLINKNTGSVRKTYWPAGGIPTFQQSLTAGSTVTGNNTVNGSGFNFSFDNHRQYNINTVSVTGDSVASMEFAPATGQSIITTADLTNTTSIILRPESISIPSPLISLNTDNLYFNGALPQSVAADDSMLVWNPTSKQVSIKAVGSSSSIGEWDGGVHGTTFSATSTTISTAAVQWTFTGSSPATFTLPARTSSVNQFYTIKNIGSADLTVAADGTDDIYTTSSVASITVVPGGSVMITGAASGTSDLWTALFHTGGSSGANTALSNLASVAVNTSLISDTDITDDLGSSSISWKDIFANVLKAGNGSISAPSISFKNSTNTGFYYTSADAGSLWLTLQGVTMGRLGFQHPTSSTFNQGNTFLGYEAGAATGSIGSTNSFHNTFIGGIAGRLNTTGNQNTGIGSRALSGNTTGNQNTAVGQGSLFNAATASSNVAMGFHSALEVLGSNNTAIGAGALQGAVGSTAAQSTAVGMQALTAVTTAANNTALGRLTLGSLTTSPNNTASGLNAGFLITTGSGGNTLNGYQAGYELTTGAYNIIVGAAVQSPSATGAGLLNIGNVVYGTGMYQSTTRTSTPTATGSIGIGLTTPTARLMLPAGTATASTAPLKFTSGTVNTTPEAGAVEFDGTNYFGSLAGTRYTLAKTLTATATLDFDLTAVNYEDLTITVTGAVDGDAIVVGVPNGAAVADVTYFGWVSGANTVTVRCSRVGGGGAANPASGTFRASVIKY